MPEQYQAGFLHAETGRHDERQVAYCLSHALEHQGGGEADGMPKEAQSEPYFEGS